MSIFLVPRQLDGPMLVLPQVETFFWSSLRPSVVESEVHSVNLQFSSINIPRSFTNFEDGIASPELDK